MRKAIGILMILVFMLVYVPFESRPARGASVSFSSPQVLQYLPGTNSYPSALQASNGTLWVVWQHYLDQIFYTTFDGSSWSPVRTLPTGTTFNMSPSMTQLGNGTIMLLWSSNQTGVWHVYYETLNGNVWSKAVQITSGPSNDVFETAVVSRNSALWVFWDRIPGPSSQQVYYKVLTGNSWSGDNAFTVDSTLNVTPGATITKDGAIRVVWSKLVAGNYYVYSRVFNGVAWSADTPLTSVATWDLEPAIVQDRNGTIWLFWSRQMQLQGGTNPIFQQKIFSKFSTDNGQTWSGDTQLTFAGDATRPIDDLSPFAVQGNTLNVNGTIDHGLWVFFSSDLTGLGSNFDIYYLRSSQIYPVHDIAVRGASSFPTRMFPWGLRALNIATATISVTVADLGDFPETVSLSVVIQNTTTYSLQPTSFLISSGASRVVSFSWNASTASPGIYTITGSVAPVPGETIGNVGDNTLTSRALAILYPGDLNLDGRVSIIDASIFGAAWNSAPGMPNWNPDADISYNAKVDIFDASIFGANWQKSV
jgi:hypothetical protein